MQEVSPSHTAHPRCREGAASVFPALWQGQSSVLWGEGDCSPGWGSVGSSALGPCWEACNRISRTCRQTHGCQRPSKQWPTLPHLLRVSPGHRGAQAASQEHLLKLCPVHAVALMEMLPGGSSCHAVHLLAPSQIQGRVAAALPVPCLPLPMGWGRRVGAMLHSWLLQLHGQLLLLGVSVRVTAGF